MVGLVATNFSYEISTVGIPFISEKCCFLSVSLARRRKISDDLVVVCSPMSRQVWVMVDSCLMPWTKYAVSSSCDTRYDPSRPTSLVFNPRPVALVMPVKTTVKMLPIFGLPCPSVLGCQGFPKSFFPARTPRWRKGIIAFVLNEVDCFFKTLVLFLVGLAGLVLVVQGVVMINDPVVHDGLSVKVALKNWGRPLCGHLLDHFQHLLIAHGSISQCQTLSLDVVLRHDVAMSLVRLVTGQQLLLEAIVNDGAEGFKTVRVGQPV